MKGLSAQNPDFPKIGLRCHHGQPRVMERFHRHHEIELNLIEKGGMTYFFGKNKLTLNPGKLTVFWGSIPHQVIQIHPQTQFYYLTVPLAWILQWNLPKKFIHGLLQGEVFMEPSESEYPHDFHFLDVWNQNLKENNLELQNIVLLEVEARLRRLNVSLMKVKPPSQEERRSLEGFAGNHPKVEAMACYIAEHYRESLTVAQISEAVNLHPEYAMNLFKKSTGVTLMNCLKNHRVSHAQRSLALTDAKILDIALDAGFGSASQFYAIFNKECGCSPRIYREDLRKRNNSNS